MQGQGAAVISEGTVLKGEIRNVRQLDVHGYIEGRITGGSVVIHPGGRVFGTVKSETLDVRGTFQGDAAIRTALHIGNGGSVRGNVRYGRLSVEAGGELEADVRNIPPELAGDFNITVRQRGHVVVTTVDLTAFDPDDGAATLTYAVSNVVGGHVALSGAPAVPVAAFTQVELAAGHVLYVHDGVAAAGAFDVVVSDKAGATSGAPKTVSATVLAA